MKNSFLLFLFTCAALVFPPNAVFAEDEECHCDFTGIEPESAPGKLCSSFEVLASATMTCSTELAPGESATTNVVVRHVSGEAPPESVGVTIKAKCIHGKPLSKSGTIEIEYEDMEEDSDSGTGAGKDDKRLNSMHWQVSLGETPGGRTAGHLVLESETMNELLFTPRSLALKGSRVQDVIYEPGASRFHQILANECLVDVTNSSAHGYGLRFYDSKDIVGLQIFYTCYDLDPLDENGYRPPITFADSPQTRNYLLLYDTVVTNEWYEIKAQAQPFASYTIENPDGSNICDRLQITKLRSGLPAEVSEFSCQNGLWSLSEEEDKTTTLAIQNDNGLTVKTWQVSGKNGVTSMTRKTYATIGDRQLPVEIVDDPQGVARTTTFTYFTNATDTVNIGRLQTQVNPDGSWKSVTYDAGGRESEVRSGWLDGGPEDDCRLATYSYTPFLPTNYFPVGVPFDDGQTDWNTPRVETVSIAGTPISKTLRSVAMDAMDYRIIEEVRLLDPTVTNLVAAWEDSTNPHTFSKYMPENNSKPCSKLPELIIRPDGTTTHYDYIDGYCTNGVNSLPGDFVLVSGGPHFRTTITYGTKDSITVSPDGLTTNRYCGVPGRTTREVTIATKAGNRELQRESYVCTAPDTYERVSWTTTSRDELGRVVATRSSDGTYTEKSWNGDLLAYEIGADGVRIDYTYDALGRVASATVSVAEGAGSPAPRVATTIYDAENRVLSSTVSAGGLLQTTTNRYDGAGRLVWSRSPDGLETAYDYGTTAAGLPYTSTIRGFGTALASTNTTVRHKDGQIAWTEFNGVRKTTYAYGVNADGSRWTLSVQGDLTEALASQLITYQSSLITELDFPWEMQLTDPLGRTIREERPGYDGAILVTENTYNAAGQLLATTQSTIVGSVPSVLSVDLYSYDALGEAVVSARDINLDGQIDYAGPDIVSSNATAYVQLGSAWWRESRQYAFPDTGSSAPLLVSTSRQCLSGLGGSESTVIGTAALVSESVSIDALGNTSTRKSYLNRDAHATASVSTTPSSTLPAYSITVGGLSLTNCTSSGIVSSREYDALGRVAASTDGRGNATTLSYDAQGRVSWTESPLSLGEGQGEGASVARTTYGYDALGRQVAVTNALGEATYTAYDAENRVVSTWGATYPVAYAYDAFGRMTAMNTFRDEAMQNGDTTTWLYEDATGVLTNKVYADGKGPSYTYTPDGKLSTRTWARGIATAYAYNASGRLTGVDYSDATPDVAYTYDRLGRQKVAQTFLSAHHYAYDPATLAMVSETIIDLQAGTSNVITRATDALGRSTGFSVAGVGDPGQPYSVAYGYDAYGRFQSVESAQSADTFTYTYLSGSDLVSGMTASSGHAWSRSYEPARSLITAVENRFGETVVSRFDYANDEIGRRTAISRSGTAFDVPVQDAYGYNTRSEVTSARRTLVGTPSQEVRGFSYDYAFDGIGNRTSATEYDHEDNALMSSYTANELNQYEQRTVPGYAGVRGSATNNATVTVNGNSAWRLGEYFYGSDEADNAASAIMKELDITAVVNPPGTNTPDLVESVTGKVYVAKSPEAFTHDDDGNLTQDGRFTYTWDGENRLIAVATRADLPASVPRVKVTYAYDHQSRRIGKIVSNLDVETWTVTESRSFLYDGWNMIREIQQSNIPSFHSSTNSYIWGLDLSGSLQGAGGVGGLLAVVQDSATYVPAWDGNGNVMEYVSTDGTLAAHYEYSPFGETVVQAGPLADAFTFRFSTKYWEEEGKRYYYGYRFYMPSAGRWVNRDSIGERGGLNLYVFVENHPSGWVDMLGLVSCCGDHKYDPEAQCCESGSVVSKVTDDANQSCCPSEIVIVELRVRRMGHHRWRDPGHAFVATPGVVRGYYPARGGIYKLTGPGEVRDDSSTRYDPSNTYSYRACPVSVSKLQESIGDPRQEGIYDLLNLHGGQDGRNCAGWACQAFDDAGFTAPFPPDTPFLVPGILPGRGYGSGRQPL